MILDNADVSSTYVRTFEPSEGNDQEPSPYLTEYLPSNWTIMDLQSSQQDMQS
jgi:hypothetical protein